MERTIEQIEEIFRAVVIEILGLPKNTRKSVRFPYGSTAETGDAPALSRASKVCFIYVLPGEDLYGTLSNLSYIEGTGDKLTLVDQHTNVYRINFVCYGAGQWARQLKAGLIRRDIRDLLYRNGLFLVSGSMSVTRVPEVKDGEWWNRYDLTTTFYEAVRLEEKNSVGIIQDVHITSATEKGWD